MPATVYHAFTSPVADGTITQLVKPSNWNEPHVISMSLASNEVIKYLQAGTNSVSSGTVSFADSNGVSFGMDTSGKITASHNALVQSVADALYTPRALNSSPNGFPDRTKVSVVWDDATRTLTATPTGASFEIWSNGTKYVKSTAQSVTIANTEGNHFMYFDDSGTLVETTTFSTDLILRWGLVSILYWNTSLAKAVPDAQIETHGLDWPSEVHLQQHVTVGVRYQDGILAYVSAEQDGSLDAHMEVATSLGHTWDEDIQHTFPARLASDSIPILCRTGATGWEYVTSSGPIVRTGGTGLAAYNFFNGSAWTQAEITDTWFGVAYLYAMPSQTAAKRLVIVQGQAQYATQAEAGIAASQIPELGTMPVNEMKLIAAIAFQTNSGYTNSVKSRVVRIGDSLGADYVDWRFQSAIQVAVAGSGISLHVDTMLFDHGIVSFENSNGVSFLTTGGSVVGSHDGIRLSNSSLFQQTSATSAITSAAFPSANTTQFAGLGFSGTNVSGTVNSNGIQLSIAPGGGAGDGYNIIGVNGASVGSAATIQFSNSNNISFGLNGSTITASASQSQQPMAYSAANGSNTANTLVFADSNGVSFSTGTQGVYATVQTNYLQNATVFSNSNNVSFGLNGSTVTASIPNFLTTAMLSNAGSNFMGLNTALTANGVSMTANSSGLSLNFPAFLTTAAQSGHSHGNPTLALTNLSGTTASASNGLTISLSAAAPGAGGGAAIQGSGTYSQNTGTIQFANSNNITFGLSNNGAMTASFSQSNQVNTWNFGGNTTGQSSSSTMDGTVYVSGAGIASVGMSLGTMIVSVPAGGGVGDGGNTLAAGGSTAASNGIIQFSNANGVSFGLNGSTMTASVNAGGGALPLYLSYQNRQLGASGSTQFTNNQLWMVPFRVAGGSISGSTIQVIQSLGGTYTSAVAATHAQTMKWCIYGQNTAALSQMDSLSSGSLTWQVWNSGTSSGSWAMNGSTSSSAGTGIFTQISGVRMLDIPLGTTVGTGLYMMAFAASSSSAGYSGLLTRYGMVVDNPMPLAMGLRFGSAAATSLGYGDAGTYSVTSAAFPATVSLSQVLQHSNLVPYFKIGAL